MSTNFTVTLEESGAQFSCPDGECVLSAMEHQGLKHIPVGCRGGGVHSLEFYTELRNVCIKL